MLFENVVQRLLDGFVSGPILQVVCHSLSEIIRWIQSAQSGQFHYFDEQIL